MTESFDSGTFFSPANCCLQEFLMAYIEIKLVFDDVEEFTEGDPSNLEPFVDELIETANMGLKRLGVELVKPSQIELKHDDPEQSIH
jgi:hypothetical protein